MMRDSATFRGGCHVHGKEVRFSPLYRPLASLAGQTAETNLVSPKVFAKQWDT